MQQRDPSEGHPAVIRVLLQSLYRKEMVCQASFEQLRELIQTSRLLASSVGHGGWADKDPRLDLADLLVAESRVLLEIQAELGRMKETTQLITGEVDKLK